MQPELLEAIVDCNVPLKIFGSWYEHKSFIYATIVRVTYDGIEIEEIQTGLQRRLRIDEIDMIECAYYPKIIETQLYKLVKR